MRALNRLSAAKIPHLPDGRHLDGGGLYLTKRGPRASWIFRYRDRATGKQRDKGLGPLAYVSLAQARKAAQQCRLQLLDGIDPIDAQRARITAKRDAITFGRCAERYIAMRAATWRNAKHAQQWTNTLNTYAEPLLAQPVDAIDTTLVLKCLEPEWLGKHETMTRVRQRIENVLDWAHARKYRRGENPARWRGHLDKLLPAIPKKQRVVHRAALPYAELGAFMADLSTCTSTGARVLQLQILTAVRPGEAAGAQWSEIDLDARVWTIPRERMKAGAEHRVPLSDAAVTLLRNMPRIDDNVFPGVRGRPITTAAAMKTLKTLRPGLTCHGFRSTFRDWAGDCTAYPRDVIEAALAHTLRNATEAAYRRGDAFHKRAQLMNDWAEYCTHG